MKSLIIKDVTNIASNIKSLAITSVAMVFLFNFISPSPMSIIVMVAVMFGSMIFTTFSFDDASSWESYALTMPITRRDIVLSKYITLIIFSVVGAIVGTCGGFIVMTLQNNYNFLLLGIGSISSIAISLLIYSINMPLIFKYGSEKGRMMLMAVVLLPVAIIFILGSSGITDGWADFLNTHWIIAIVAFVVLIVGAVAGSYIISDTIYKNKEIE